MSNAHPYPDLVDRPEALRLRELANDLAAVWPTPDVPVDGWMMRPSILRRVASEMAARVAGDVDRVIALGPGASVLGSAVSLATGLPFCAVQPDGTSLGARHRGETVVVISVDGERRDPDWLSAFEVAQRLSVVPGASDAHDCEPLITRWPLRNGPVTPLTKENPND
ncbi:hypothetical protein FVA74_12980 [Salinibacterium sp. dk2585]|uniref:hypothetical protein n=1 Tax=unclassified Salinibacterium TaxID=2632331 RepID=UPI0011C24A2F|nr:MULTISPECIES: hypothetical protein [unclassified Salinibacterium]QEE62386.1 hypothetical protein FVA74_12980 [Salinibacterium sp. dk2585]TXK52731.1 hypothetical protein FVP63_12415 [Salinibacterium sp. dk5596]